MKFVKYLILIILLLIGLCLSVHGENDASFSIRKLTERVVVFSEDSPMENNVTAINSAKGVVVIDTCGSTISAARVKEEIEKLFKRKDYAFVINTHHHWDHAWGNQVFQGINIIGHENCLDTMKRDSERIPQTIDNWRLNIEDMKTRLTGLDPVSQAAVDLKKRLIFSQRNYRSLNGNFHLTPPSITFRDAMTLDLGDLTLELVYFGRAHSGSDILIHIPEERILLTGDIFLDRGWLPLFAGQNRLDIDRWIRVLRSFSEGEQKLRYVIPGHQDLWSHEKLVLWLDYIVEIWRAVQQGVAEDKDSETLEKSIALADDYLYLKKFGHSDDRITRFHRRNIRAFWRQLKESAALEVEQLLKLGDVTRAIERCKEIKARKDNNYYIAEDEFNRLGYRLLGDKKFSEAIAVFKVNTGEFPESFNVFDSLAEAYMLNGEKELAVKNYRKSLELNPENNNARLMLKKLGLDQ